MLTKLISIFKPKVKPESQQVNKNPYAEVKVWFDDLRIWVQYPGEKAESIAWKLLLGIAIETTDQGPFVEGFYWHLGGVGKVLTYPGEATGAEVILPKLQDLPTFNNETMIQATMSVENQKFIVWDSEGRHETNGKTLS